MKMFSVALAIVVGGVLASVRAANIPSTHTAIPVLLTLSSNVHGSGFYLSKSNYAYLVTAKHVLFNEGNLIATNAVLTSHVLSGTNGGMSEIRLNLAGLESIKEIRAHPTHDVAVVRMGVIKSNNVFLHDVRYVAATNHGPSAPIPVQFEHLRKLKDVNPADDIYVFGYPVSIGLQRSPRFNYRKPLLRKGIVAGVNDESRTIVIDAPVYGGNSGGPVVVRELISQNVAAFYVVGIVTEFIPFVDVWESARFRVQNTSVANSGYAVVEPADFIQELLWE